MAETVLISPNVTVRQARTRVRAVMQDQKGSPKPDLDRTLQPNMESANNPESAPASELPYLHRHRPGHRPRHGNQSKETREHRALAVTKTNKATVVPKRPTINQSEDRT